MTRTPQEALEAAQRKVVKLYLAQGIAFATGSHADWEKVYNRYLLALEAKDVAEYHATVAAAKGVR